MVKSTAPISEQIIQAITDAGGSISAEDLADALPDVAYANLNYHLKAMMNRGRIHATGTRVRRVFHLGDGKQAETATAEAPAPEAPKPAAAEESEIAFVVAEPSPSPQQRRTTSTVSPHHLRRLLAMALRAPEPISEADRQELAAVAEEALAA